MEGLIGILGVTILCSLTVSVVGYILYGNKA